VPRSCSSSSSIRFAQVLVDEPAQTGPCSPPATPFVGPRELPDHVARPEVSGMPWRNTAVYTAVVVPGQVGIGLALAVALPAQLAGQQVSCGRCSSSPVISAAGDDGHRMEVPPRPADRPSSPTFWYRWAWPDIAFLQSTTWALPAVIAVGHLEERRVLHGDLPGRASGTFPGRSWRRPICRRRRPVAPVSGASPCPCCGRGALFAVVIATITSHAAVRPGVCDDPVAARSSTPTRWSRTYTRSGSRTSAAATRPPSHGCCSC